MSTRAQLQAMLEKVASGTVSPALATEAIAKWMVLMIDAATRNGVVKAAFQRAVDARACDVCDQPRGDDPFVCGTCIDHAHGGRALKKAQLALKAVANEQWSGLIDGEAAANRMRARAQKALDR